MIFIALCTQMVLPWGRGRSVHTCPSPKTWFHTLCRRHVLYTGPSILLVLLVLLLSPSRNPRPMIKRSTCKKIPAAWADSQLLAFLFYSTYLLTRSKYSNPAAELCSRCAGCSTDTSKLWRGFLTSCSKFMWVLHRTKHLHQKWFFNGGIFSVVLW
jgi:hypothetical protein